MGASEKDQISELIEKLATERSTEQIEDAKRAGYRQAVDDVIAALSPLFKVAQLKVTVEPNENAELEEIRIEDLNFTVRTYNCLKREGVHNLLQLSQMTFEQMLDIRNFGYKSIREAQAKLQEHGLSVPGFDLEQLPDS